MDKAKIFEQDFLLSDEEDAGLEAMFADHPTLIAEAKDASIVNFVKALNQDPSLIDMLDPEKNDVPFNNSVVNEIFQRYIGDLVQERDFAAVALVGQRSAQILESNDVGLYAGARALEQMPQLLAQMDIMAVQDLFDSTGAPAMKAKVQRYAKSYVMGLLRDDYLNTGINAVNQLLEGVDTAEKLGLMPSVSSNELTEHKRNLLEKLVFFAGAARSNIVTDLTSREESIMDMFTQEDDRYSRLFDTVQKIDELRGVYDIRGVVDFEVAEILDAVRDAATEIEDTNKAVSILKKLDSEYKRIDAPESKRHSISVKLAMLGDLEESARIAGELKTEQFWPERLWAQIGEEYLNTEKINDEEFGRIGGHLGIPEEIIDIFGNLKTGAFADAANTVVQRIDNFSRAIEYLRESKPEQVQLYEFRHRNYSNMAETIWNMARSKFENKEKGFLAGDLRAAAKILGRPSDAEEAVYRRAFGDGKTESQYTNSIEPVLASGREGLKADLFNRTAEAYTNLIITDTDVMMTVAESLDMTYEGRRVIAETHIEHDELQDAALNALQADEYKDELVDQIWSVMQDEGRADDDKVIKTAAVLEAGGIINAGAQGHKIVAERYAERIVQETDKVTEVLAEGGDVEYDFSDWDTAVQHARSSEDLGIREALLNQMIDAYIRAGSLQIDPEEITSRGADLNLGERANMAVGAEYMNQRDFIKAAEHLMKGGQAGLEMAGTIWRELEKTKIVGYDALVEGEGEFTETQVMEIADRLSTEDFDESRRVRFMLAEKAMTRLETLGTEKLEEEEIEPWLDMIASHVDVNRSKLGQPMFDVMLEAAKNHKADTAHLAYLAGKMGISQQGEFEAARIMMTVDPVKCLEHALNAGPKGQYLIATTWDEQVAKYNELGTSESLEQTLKTMSILLDKIDDAFQLMVDNNLKAGLYERAAFLAVSSGIDRFRGYVKSAIDEAIVGHNDRPSVSYKEAYHAFNGMGFVEAADTARGMNRVFEDGSIDYEITAEPMSPEEEVNETASVEEMVADAPDIRAEEDYVTGPVRSPTAGADMEIYSAPRGEDDQLEVTIGTPEEEQYRADAADAQSPVSELDRDHDTGVHAMPQEFQQYQAGEIEGKGPADK